MGFDDFSLFHFYAFTKSFQARDDLRKHAHNVPPSRLENPFFEKKNDLGQVFVGGSQVTVDKRQVLACAQYSVAAA